MAYLGAKKAFQSLVFVGTWILIAIFASTLLLSGRATKRELTRDDKVPSVRHIEESSARPTRSTNVSSNEDQTRRVTQQPKAVTIRKHIEFYHHLYPVNCSAVFHDDKKEIARVDAMLREEKAKSGLREIVVPPDVLVANYSEDCEFYRRARDYPTKVLSEEEEEFPLAFIILTHKNAAQVELLLRAIYQPHNVYAIHPDAKSPPQFQRAIRNLARCFDNVFVCSKLETIKYAGFTRLLADINCMHDLVKHPVQWRYVINQCGEAFPLKTNLEMVQQIKAYNGLNDAEGYDAPHKLARFHKFSPLYKLATSTRERLLRFPPPGNISLYSGNAYNTFSRQFIEYVLSDQLPIRFLNWINMTYSPDEHFWASLQRVPDAPGGYRNITHKDINTTYVKWAGEKSSKECVGQYVRGICVMSTGYLSHVARQPHLFCNKFHYSYDPVTMQCMQELLTNRTRIPELRKQHFEEFPKKRDWYWY